MGSGGIIHFFIHQIIGFLQGSVLHGVLHSSWIIFEIGEHNGDSYYMFSFMDFNEWIDVEGQLGGLHLDVLMNSGTLWELLKLWFRNISAFDDDVDWDSLLASFSCVVREFYWISQDANFIGRIMFSMKLVKSHKKFTRSQKTKKKKLKRKKRK